MTLHLRLTQNSERLHINLIIWPNAPEEIFEGDSVQTHATCWTSLSLSLWRRTIELAKSTSSGLVPSLLFPDDSAFLRDGIEDEVPSTTRMPSTFRSSILLQSVSRWSRRSRRWHRWKDSEISPQTIENEGEFPGQETWNRYRLTNRGLRITDSMDPTESVSSALP